ncbi:uncharacterized protein N7446_007887 [Penicillium canescens]|uniref:Uncharacterized protein n=1 Tax=Penicillium canescens TaxID=5083 RepID=A0AAD6INR8_PENCN|nr:uncharacterized protein N7446_007887 [Penicillium canescens]KAJ6033821.1 hypothetical protein N7444_011592 [Penicillium canescens]KAJ6056988.1 hypothetical protein N7460_000262 [Penicillium canescens]KAJ6058304.1 hypothetical protein N7446_007887 [Penicillium canescens]
MFGPSHLSSPPYSGDAALQMVYQKVRGAAENSHVLGAGPDVHGLWAWRLGSPVANDDRQDIYQEL